MWDSKKDKGVKFNDKWERLTDRPGYTFIKRCTIIDLPARYQTIKFKWGPEGTIYNAIDSKQCLDAKAVWHGQGKIVNFFRQEDGQPNKDWNKFAVNGVCEFGTIYLRKKPELGSLGWEGLDLILTKDQ